MASFAIIILLLVLVVRYLLKVIDAQGVHPQGPEPETRHDAKWRETAETLERKLEQADSERKSAKEEAVRLRSMLQESQEACTRLSRRANHRESFNEELKRTYNQNASTSSSDRAAIHSLRLRVGELDRDNARLSAVIKTMKCDKELDSAVEAARTEERSKAEARIQDAVTAVTFGDEISWMNTLTSTMGDSLRQQLLSAKRDSDGSFGMAEIGSTIDKVLNAATMASSDAQEEITELRRSSIKETDVIEMLAQISPAVAARIRIPDRSNVMALPAFGRICEEIKHILDQEGRNVAQAMEQHAQAILHKEGAGYCKSKLQSHVASLQRLVSKLEGDLKKKEKDLKAAGRLSSSKAIARAQDIKIRERAVDIDRERVSQQYQDLNIRVDGLKKQEEELQRKQQTMQAEWNRKEGEVAAKLQDIEEREALQARQRNNPAKVDQDMQDVQPTITPPQGPIYKSNPVKPAYAQSIDPALSSRAGEAFNFPRTPTYKVKAPSPFMSHLQSVMMGKSTFPDKRHMPPVISSGSSSMKATPSTYPPKPEQGEHTEYVSPLGVQKKAPTATMLQTGQVGAPSYTPIFSTSPAQTLLQSSLNEQARSPTSQGTAMHQLSTNTKAPERHCLFKEADGSQCEDTVVPNWSYCADHKWIEEGEKYHELHSSTMSLVFNSSARSGKTSERKEPLKSASKDVSQSYDLTMCLYPMEGGGDCPCRAAKGALFCTDHESVPTKSENQGTTSNKDTITAKELEDELENFLDGEEDKASNNTAAANTATPDQVGSKPIDTASTPNPPAADFSSNGTTTPAIVRRKPRPSIFINRRPTARTKKPSIATPPSSTTTTDDRPKCGARTTLGGTCTVPKDECKVHSYTIQA
ncbi:hypothetical protein K431DRAFT_328716 [Polychaeton citri CBS 116435]|uniref:Uncharacterized protein n=1 Tax=Polychaeton citri CBS 116435 TaxID=1314669 RepID=A0A9P4QAP5_9PEZI|nr:hypothetical protein K431DRAFT_328716 [Polychaeton citri CBS 116435]